MIPFNESAMIGLAALSLVGVALLVLIRQRWFRRLTSSPSRRHHGRRRRRPRFRGAA
jgi:hypothetical protein